MPISSHTVDLAVTVNELISIASLVIAVKTGARCVKLSSKNSSSKSIKALLKENAPKMKILKTNKTCVNPCPRGGSMVKEGQSVVSTHGMESV